jgi:hypothetical protein
VTFNFKGKPESWLLEIMPEQGTPSLDQWLTELTIRCTNSKSFYQVPERPKTEEKKTPSKSSKKSEKPKSIEKQSSLKISEPIIELEEEDEQESMLPDITESMISSDFSEDSLTDMGQHMKLINRINP